LKVINSIGEYLRLLKQQLTGADRATVQDALSDAEEYLRNALEHARRQKPDVREAEALVAIIEGYGLPEEVAVAYRQIETRPIRIKLDDPPSERAWWQRFFGIVADPQAWSATLFMLFSLATGIIYFTWTVTGFALSAGLLVLIIGIPFAGVFLLSIRWMAWLVGRLVEALLGVRMPHRPLFSNKTIGLWARFKNLISDRYTWTAMVYMILMLPLGIIYFSLFVTLTALSIWLMARPILELVFGLPAYTIDVPYFTPDWLMPISVIGGALLGILSLHFFKLIGRLQGKLAKAMLVKD
jgi:hypothetical protein